MVDVSKGWVKIINRHAIKSLGDYTTRISIREDGNIIMSNDLPAFNLPAGKDTVISIMPYLPEMKPDCEYLADIRLTLAVDKPWAEEGHEVAAAQFALTGFPKIKIPPGEYPPLSMEEDDAVYIIEGKDFRLTINKSNGTLSSYLWNNKELIVNPLLPHFSRPLTDNDRRAWKPHIKMKEWYNPDLKLQSITTDLSAPGIIKIKSNYTLLEDKAALQLIYTLNGDGVVRVDYKLNPYIGLPNIPKVGMQCGIKREYDNITWYGRGLLENYIDRRFGFDAGIYSQHIHEFIEPYVMPQENGNRTDVRWMFLSDSGNEGLLVVANSLLSMSAWPYTEENINEAQHTSELKDAGFITLNIDLIQMGVGGNDSWSDVAQPLEKYQIPAKPHHYTFYLLPCKSKKEEISLLMKKIRF